MTYRQHIPATIYSLCEAVADLSAMFSSPGLAPNVPNDSRETIRLVIEWAHEFEEKNNLREWDGEYMEEIETFFAEKYRAWSETAADVVEHPAS